MKIFFFPALALLLTFFSCSKSDPPVNPCENEEPFQAEFSIKESVGDSLVKTDKVMQYGHVVFEAAAKYDTYNWKIGTDERTFKDRKVSLLFTDSIKNVNVRLIATKKPSKCFPNDKTIDTITKTFSVIPWREAPIIGTYTGYFDSDKSKKDSVKLIYTQAEDGWGDFTLININCGCNLDTTIGWRGSKGANAFYFNSDNAYYSGCKGPVAWLQLKGADTLVVDFTYREENTTPGSSSILGPAIKDRFIGIRRK